MTNQEDNKLWEKFALANRTYKIIDFPRYDDSGKSIGTICLRSLLQNEITQLDQAIAEEVDHSFKVDSKIWNENSSIIMERYKTRESNVMANHYLQKIIVHADNKEKLVFPTPDHVAKSLSLAEATKLMLEYYAMHEGKPDFSNLSIDKFNEWVDLLTGAIKKDAVSFLGRLQPEVKDEFITYLVSLLYNSNQLSSSLSLQLKESTKTGKEDSSPAPTKG